jgi:hypothetical protein
MPSFELTCGRPGSEAFVSSFALCSRTLRACIPLPLDSSSISLLRFTSSIKGTPPDCADPYALSLTIARAELSPSEAHAAQCAAGHDCLPFLFSNDRHACDCCASSIICSSQGWRCIDCNYDVCGVCCPLERVDLDRSSIASVQSAAGVCSGSWMSASLFAFATAGDVGRPDSQEKPADAKALSVHASYSGKDAEGWAGHHGAAFACSSLSYLDKVTLRQAQ